MTSSRKLVFFGNERLATGVTTTAPTLRKLAEKGYDVALVVSNYSEGRSRKTRTLEIAEVAKALGIELVTPKKLVEIKDRLVKVGADAGVLVAYGKIIPQEIIDIFPKGIINIHPSLLPKYRGPTPIESAMLRGEDETGVSLMDLVAKMDAGPVYAQASVELPADVSKQEISARLLNEGSDLLLSNLPDILDGSLRPKEQDDSKALYTALLDKSLAHMDTSLPAEILERQVRAYAGWPKSRITVNGHMVVVTKSRVVNSEKDGKLVIKCSPGYLEIQKLVAPSGRRMSSEEYLRGYSKN